MISHVIELIANSGQTDALVETIRDRAIPEVIRQARGFVDELLLIAADDPTRVSAISFWRSKEDGDLFFQTGFSQVSALTAPFLSAKPKRREFTVGASTNEKIVAENGPPDQQMGAGPKGR